MDRQPQVFRGHIAELNMVRALGVVWVIAVHLWPTPKVWAPLNLAWMAMDAFFVLSGFLITGILLDSRDKPDYFKSFYVGRSLRIFPLYYLVLGLAMLMFFPTSHRYVEMTHSWGSPWWFFIYLGNIPSALRNAMPPGTFMPLWSLQVEEQFYLLLPLLIYRTKPANLARILWGLILVSVLGRIAVYCWSPTDLYKQYALLPLHMDGLALGSLLAIRFRQGPWHISRRSLTVWTAAWLGVSVISASLTGIGIFSPFVRTIGILLSSIACAHIILWLILFRGSRITAALRIRPIQYLSSLSYCMYLVHMPLSAFFKTQAASTFLGTTMFSKGVPRLIAVLGLSVLVAALARRFVERPILALKDRLKQGKTSPQETKNSNREHAGGAVTNELAY